ncbi:type II toxin-antitoxin system VapC family toxin [Aromatoleum anaerobium]|uniref:PIN domain-containing protein n=1 Tax=Aromatoleum anaerobium TaxID=182180 RepID=A0ABX1PJB1_9RHOO|nr:type II toxin-antitoxin system VapC family toxin [Aromatoleum anaerobium]MCK0507184.1 type II toxin-antitoxin system VapC family toxin [Aromatoleum anaerobium]
MSCVVDTNLLIYFLADAVDESVLQRIEQALRDQARISVITRMEVLGWRGHTDDSRARARFLLDQLDEIALTSPVVERVIEIRSSLAIKLPDAIIAASALIENLPLMTRNIADFKRVPGLVLMDPFAA